MKSLWILLLALFLIRCENQEQLDKSFSQGVKGVWLTNVASKALVSRANIERAVKECYDLGFNTIYMVTWNKNLTMFKSKVAEGITGFEIDPNYGERDPLQELIEVAHGYDIKVIAWFEFGFASANGDETGGLIIQKKPEWASRDIDGNITEKNNFYWLNPFHTEVKEFMIDLIVECVQNYDIDGIQGDDRLPALPSNGGYDSITVDLYKSEHDGNPPPNDYLEPSWLSWRADKLTDFLEVLVDTLRLSDPDLLISMAPSIYPWSKTNYLQDWPRWLEKGLLDEVIPQVYRYNFSSYKGEIDKIVEDQVSTQDLDKVRSGVLLQVNDYVASEELLDSFINYHRENKIEGEVYFFYEGIGKRADFFRSIYK